MSKNYITPGGFKTLQDEFKQLYYDERPKLVETITWAAGNGDRSENGDYIYGKKRLRQIDGRLKKLRDKIESAVIVKPNEITNDKVVFSSLVTLEDDNGKINEYQIVGEDEFNIKEQKISWKSPLAKALFGKKVDDEVKVKTPKDDVYYTILKIKIPND